MRISDWSSDVCSSDLARQDPRRNTSSIGIYPHVRDRWGIFYAQPFVLNERQAGVAIEGVVRQESIETSQLAVDRSEEHMSELQSLMRNSYAVFCMTKTTITLLYEKN